MLRPHWLELCGLYSLGAHNCLHRPENRNKRDIDGIRTYLEFEVTGHICEYKHLNQFSISHQKLKFSWDQGVKKVDICQNYKLYLWNKINIPVTSTAHWFWSFTFSKFFIKFIQWSHWSSFSSIIWISLLMLSNCHATGGILRKMLSGRRFFLGWNPENRNPAVLNTWDISSTDFSGQGYSPVDPDDKISDNIFLSMCRTFLPCTDRTPDRIHSVRPVPRMITSYSSSMFFLNFLSKLWLCQSLVNFGMAI